MLSKGSVCLVKSLVHEWLIVIYEEHPPYPDRKLRGKNTKTTPPSPLYYAVKMDLKDVAISFVTEQNANERSTFGRSPLGIACAKGSIEVVDLMLQNRADITVADNQGVTPVIAALSNGHVEVVKLLLENGADITAANKRGVTPIYTASDKGRVEVVKLLLENGADITVANNAGWTPVNAASLNEHAELVTLSLGGPHIDASKPDDLGRTALFFASRYGHYQAAQVLLSEGRVNPDVRDWMGSTVLVAAVANGHLHVAKLLITSGAAVEMQGGVGQSLMWWALRAGNTELIQLLMEHAETVGTRIADDPVSSDLVSTPFDHEAPWCDACTLSIQGRYRYSCSVCDTGFCLCIECYDRGVQFCNKGHVLILNKGPRGVTG